MSDKMASEILLSRLISNAFEENGYCPPNEVTSCTCDHCQDLKKSFHNKTWQALVPEQVREQYSHLCLLNDDAFQYYLPAYLLCSLQSESPQDDEVTLFTVLCLGGTLQDYPSHENQERHRAGLLTKNQVAAVVAYLEHIVFNTKDDEDLAERAYEALVRVWHPIKQEKESTQVKGTA